VNPLSVIKGLRLVWLGKTFGNEIADYLLVNRRLFHNALELGGLSNHLILLGMAARAKQSKGEMATLVSGYLIDGIEVMNQRFGCRPIMKDAMKNTLMFRGEVDGFDPLELMTAIPYNRGLAYRATR